MNRLSGSMARGRLRNLCLIGLILMAFALRLYKLDAQSLWYDEGVTADVAQRGIRELTQWTANDIQPPLYYYVVAGWGRLAGWCEWSLRFPSAFFGVLTVPLLAAFALRLTRRVNAAFFAALLTTLHPLLLYYSQEARMYALLTALGVLIGYCVLRLAVNPKDRRFYLFYSLTAVAAIYTHYFAFFLLAAFGGALLFEQWRVHSREMGQAIRDFVLANLLVLVLYLPWFTFLFTRLAIDASYWQGQLKLWEALRSVAVSFSSGQTVQEAQAIQLLIPYALVTLLALLLLIWQARNDRTSRTLTYALPWLILPVIAVLVLASFAPKFNARYVMIALPGLILIWAGGFSKQIGYRDSIHRPLLTNLYALCASLSMIFLLATFLYADRNWFVDSAFTKDDWRDVASFLHERIQPNETVVLVSGHAWPVWHYYAPDLPAVRLPDIDVLDVNAVLTFANTAGPLRAAFANETGKTGAWIVEWQNDIVDPTGVVPVQLELAGREKGQPSLFWKLNVRRFANIKPKHIADASPISTALNVNFGSQLILHGYTVVDNGDLLLFWERPPSSQAQLTDIQITGQISTTNGALITELRDQRPAGYAYPVARWPVGELVMGRIPAASWLGDRVVDGTYQMRLSVYTVTSGVLTKLSTNDGHDFIELAPLTVRQD
ncbi:hypothetical protein BH10CHL1_BH10CHL1_16350 [soil metagenome]